ncbi:MAG: PorT family protein [Flavobacteriales bacterium]|nr:PorT family protein [Flavobacteriales bacterium]
MRFWPLSVILCMSLSATAQTQERPAFLQGHQGPRIGFGMASQSSGALFGNSSNLLFGPLGGWHFEAPLHPQMSLMPEVLYMAKGFVVRNPAQGTRSRSVYRYLEVPLLLKISTDKGEDGMYLLAGPSVGYFLSGRTQTWLNGQLNTDIKYDLTDSNRRLQFSGVVGMGMEGDRWAFDVRAQTSLTPFDSFQRVQNVVYALTIAHRIPGKKPPAREKED